MADLIDRLAARLGGSEVARQLILAAQKGDLCIPFDGAAFPPSLLSEGRDDIPFPSTPLVHQGGRLYLQRNWSLETLIVTEVTKLLQRSPPELVRPAIQGRLAPSQLQAIEQAFGRAFAIFAGGPGTGKTYTAAHFIRLLAGMHPKYKVAIAAPTGKAASRLEEVLLAGDRPPSLICKTSTLHRLLSIRPGAHRLGSPKKLDVDLIVIDEASMLDHLLMAHLLEAIPSHGRLLLLGDANQLPPIESGSLFAEMAALFGATLTQSLRMEKGPLQETADLLCKGDADGVIRQLKDGENWIQWDQISPQMLAQWLKPEGRRILTPLRRGPFGVDQLNRELKSMLRWRSIPILIKQNDPKTQLWNGVGGSLIDGVAHFGSRTFPVAMLPLYEEAFSISIHKSQGSEYDEVLVLFPPGSETFGKEALYTAVTRAKKKAIIASTEETIRNTLAQKERRRSGFTSRIRF